METATATLRKKALQQEPHSLVHLAGKYLTFRLGNEGYGLEILKVQEIIGMQPITGIPRTPAAIKGVINLRGKVIPVIDMRIKFGMEAREASRKTCIIVVQTKHGAAALTLGVIVDEVSEVLEIESEAIEPAPAFGSEIQTDFILGMAKTKDAVKILLDLDRVLTDRELSAALHAG